MEQYKTKLKTVSEITDIHERAAAVNFLGEEIKSSELTLDELKDFQQFITGAASHKNEAFYRILPVVVGKISRLDLTPPKKNACSGNDCFCS